jgi:tRNA(Ile2) C34 agmatinyltransferase TiaS
MTLRPKIIRNSAHCDMCNEEVESKFRHDFRSCSCNNISVDGGKDYIKRSWGGGKWHDTSITDPPLTDDEI